METRTGRLTGELLAAPYADRSTDSERWVVRGGPGAGKSALVTRVVRSALDSGLGADDVLVLVRSAHAGGEMLDAITSDRESEVTTVATEPMVRTVHSLAYGVLRLAAAREDAPAPRLLTGAEHDAIIRESLLGEADDGAAAWPAHLRPALTTVGFARQLRDLLLRSQERGIDPRQLAAMGRRARRPEWVAAAGFFDRHEQQMQLRSGLRAEGAGTPVELNAAELVGVALDALDADPELAAQYRRRTVVAVDDAHLLDPLAAELITRVGGAARLLVVAEDSDQSVFRFRGAGGQLARFVLEQGGRRLDLPGSERLSPAVARVAARVAERLPGASAHRLSEDSFRGGDGVARRRTLATPAAEAAAVADFLRRRHVMDGVPWSEMAVLPRSAPSVVDELTHALDHAGVPVIDAGAEVPPTRDPVVAALLSALRSVVSTPDVDDVLALLAGPLGRADPLALSRLRRGVRRVSETDDERSSVEHLRVLLLAGADELSALSEGLTPIELAPVRRVRAVREAAVDAARAPAGVEETLWAVWQASGLEKLLVARSRTIDDWARQADRSLDAVMALFEHAADFVDRVPRGSVSAFLEHVAALDLPAPRRADSRHVPEAVSIMSAHSAVGREWTAVAVCGVQDDVWPAPLRRSGVLHIDEFVELTERQVDGASDEPIPGEDERLAVAAAERAAEERRLFYVATSRASRYLLVTAVESPGEGESAPSRFLDELDGLEDVDAPDPAASAPGVAAHLPDPHMPAVLSLPALVAELRAALEQRVAVQENEPVAAAVLSDLAGADVAGAGTDEWYRAVPPEPALRRDPAETDNRATLSPSAFEKLEQCPLRWYLERMSGTEGDRTAMLRGTVVHLLCQAVEGGVEQESLELAVRRHWPGLTGSRGVFVEREISQINRMVESFRRWRENSRTDFETAGVEVPLRFVVRPAGESGAPEVTVRGRIDRLERDRGGGLTAVDIKTAATAVSQDDASVHPQLALYQLGVHSGAVEESTRSSTAAGGLLLYVGTSTKSGYTQRSQDPVDAGGVDELTSRVLDAGAAQLGPEFRARTGPWCAQCPVADSCPAVEDGARVV